MKDHWRQIEKHSQSENSQSPITRVYFKYGDEKAEILNGESAQDAVRLRSSYLGNLRERVICALGFRYKLSVDISMCYSSIYTHSLSWSVCGRDEAKRNYFLEKKADRSKEYLFADELDKRIRNQKLSLIHISPCQPFSKAGYWVTNKKRRGINDPRASLIDEYLRVVTDIKPDGFVFENVESLLHPTNKVIVDQFLDIAYENGYACKVVRANALDYGVPQKRKRIFILGTQGEFKADEPKKTHCSPEKLSLIHI